MAPFTITAVDPLYLKIPSLQRDLGSGQQDSLLIRIETDVPGLVGWGEAGPRAPAACQCALDMCSCAVAAAGEGGGSPCRPPPPQPPAF